jgi:glyoxylate utilization-related uncharacterized protein
MPKVSKETATQGGDHGPVVEASEPLGAYTASFVEFRQDIDATPLLKGAPGDQCHCEHWGYVIEGRLTFRVDDHEEVFEAGDAFYLSPGHIPIGNEPGTQYLQFSPTKELAEISAVLMRNMQAMQAPQS